MAGEASVVKTLRRICVQEASIPKNDVSFMGYWRVGRTES
ncbi:SIP domain-containing protein [uncultured Rothia sp.]